MKTITIKPWVLVTSLGDGNVAVHFFNEEKNAITMFENDDEPFSEGPYQESLTIDLETGLIVNDSSDEDY